MTINHVLLDFYEISMREGFSIGLGNDLFNFQSLWDE
jgi:hypothetical protein